MKVILYARIPEWQLEYVKREDLGTEDMLRHMAFSTTPGVPGAQLGQVEVEIDFLPPEQVLASVAEMLKAKIVDIRARATAEVTQVQAKLNDLLALEHKEAGRDPK